MRRGGLPLALVLFACSTPRTQDSAPLLVRVQQAQTAPSFSHVVLKVFRDEGGKPTAMVRTSGCLAVSALPPGSEGRRRLEVEVAAGGPYYLQFTGHTEDGCAPQTAVVAGLVPGVTAASGHATLVPIFVAPLERFVVVEPAPAEGAERPPRAFHTATLADDGSLIVAGGAQEVVALGAEACARGMSRCLRLTRATSGIHRFEPGSGALVLVGALEERRFFHQATPLGDGRIAFTGGTQAATLGGVGRAGDAPFVRSLPVCTNPNESSGAGCILRSIEIHSAGWPGRPAVSRLAVGRSAHAAVRVGRGVILVAGGRQSTVQLGCSSDLQCAPGASCDSLGRCLKGGRDCAQVTNTAEVCLPGYECERSGNDAGKCLKRGCTSAEDCGGCLASGGCTGTESTCDTSTGLCTKRGCTQDSECLGSNRRCQQGTCVQVGCDSLSGCPPGRTCDVRTGKCAPSGMSVDCTQDGACDCQGDSDCASGFTCQTSGEFAGRCRNESLGCPATVCRRDVTDPDQGPYFDPISGALRREVNCQAGQCVLTGCLGDVDCPDGFLCLAGKCVNGRRVTSPTRSVELCDLSISPLPASPCAVAPDLAAPREGLASACLSRDQAGECATLLLWGGNTDPQHTAEVRDRSGAVMGEVAVPGCPSAAFCRPAFVAAAEGPSGVLLLGGVLSTGEVEPPEYTFLTLGFLVSPTSPLAAERLAASLPAPRLFAATVVIPDGILVLGGASDGALAPATAGGLYSVTGDSYQEPATLRLSVGRIGHTATLLPDGRIVVVGGLDPAGLTMLSTVEVFIPRASLR
jgi:hypothetical protein